MAFLTIVLFLGVAAALSWPLGRYQRWAMDPESLTGLAGRCDGWFRAVVGRRAAAPQSCKQYLIALLVVNAVMFAVSSLVMALQGSLPLNPDGKEGLSWHLIFNTAASFTTNTNLQHYSGEAAMSYLSQLVALMGPHFVASATGIAALTAMARALAGRQEIGNFYVDLQRATFLVLLPLALGCAFALVLCGVPMTIDGAAVAKTLEGAVQTICRGPVAAFVAIKQLGTNGGGWFGPNSTHPLENPGFVSNLIELLAIVVIPMASVWTFGRIVGRLRHAALLFVTLTVLVAGKLLLACAGEAAPTVAFAGLPIVQDTANLEGKELRFGAVTAPLWAVLTTCTSNGSVNCMHDSLNPLTGLAPLIGMWLNATFGGNGVGMINLFLYIVLAVFVAGMMVGRTPEYLQRRVETKEVRLAVLALLLHPFLILGGTALFVATPWGTTTTANPGAHGFSEILYEFSSAAANNGSGFEGLADNNVPWNLATGLVMLLGRFVPILLPLAIADSLAKKRATAPSAGTLSVESTTFGVMLLATIVFLGALTFFPAATLGPIAEHLHFSK